MTNTHLLIMVLVAGACTFATRLFPFALFGGKKQVPKFVQYLGNVTEGHIVRHLNLPIEEMKKLAKKRKLEV